MWGKKGQSARAKRPVIGNPTLVTKTLDESVYQSLSPISSPSDNGSAKLTPPLPRGNPVSPLSASPSDPDPRVASSVYSQDGTEQFDQSPYTWTQQLPSGSHSADRKPDSPVWREITDVSPPDSPISMSGANNSQESRPVSPIVDEPKPFPNMRTETEHTSQLPILRRVSQKGKHTSEPAGPRSSQHPFSRVTRWDDFSGEPTTSDNGKAGQAAPGRTPLQFQATHKQSASQYAGILGWGKEQFHPMKKFVEARNRLMKHDHTQPQREPGKGASGRSPIIQQRSRAASRANTSKTGDHIKENQAPPTFQPFGFRPSVVTTITAGESMSPAPEKRPATNPSSRKPHPIPYSAPISQESSTPPRVDLPSSTLDTPVVHLKLDEQPTSRFSSTTYDSAEYDSAAESPRESVAETQSTENISSIMSRKHPVPSGVISGKKPIRKPTPAQVPEESANKPLPECPPEKQAASRIEALEARRDTLARRRGNIDTIIHELTQVIQPSSVAYDMAARDEVKRTVSSLNNELADIKREDHELGLKLFRAYKKLDEQDANAGSTSLWVKRVTS